MPAVNPISGVRDRFSFGSEGEKFGKMFLMMELNGAEFGNADFQVDFRDGMEVTDFANDATRANFFLLLMESMSEPGVNFTGREQRKDFPLRLRMMKFPILPEALPNGEFNSLAMFF